MNTTGIADAHASKMSLNVYPNPCVESTMLSYHLDADKMVNAIAVDHYNTKWIGTRQGLAVLMVLIRSL